MLLSPMPPMRPSSRALIIVDSWRSNSSRSTSAGCVGIAAVIVYAEVHGGQSVGVQRAEVLLDAGPQLVGLLRG